MQLQLCKPQCDSRPYNDSAITWFFLAGCYIWYTSRRWLSGASRYSILPNPPRVTAIGNKRVPNIIINNTTNLF